MIKKSFFIFFFYNFFQIFQYVKDQYSYQYEDWLINYSNGFVRRGLIGEIFYFIYNYLNINLNVIIFVFLVLLIGIFYYKSYKLFYNLKSTFTGYLVLFSPFFYTFYITNHNAGIRKEFLLFLFFIFLIERKKNFSTKQLWIFSTLFPVLILVHEGLIFFLPFFLLILIFIKNDKNQKSINYQILTTTFFSCFIAFLSVIFNGSEIHVYKICASLEKFVKETCEIGGSIKHLSDDLLPSIKLVLYEHDAKSVIEWMIIFLYGFFPLFYLIKKVQIKNKFNLFENIKFFSIKKKIIFFLILCFISILPLFVISFDWGRWLSIYFHLTAFVLIFLINKKILVIEKNLIDNFFDFKSKYVKILTIIIYATFVTPSVFDKKTDDNLNPFKFNYIKLFKKTINKI